MLYIKDVRKYDDFVLKQFAAKMKRLEAREVSFEDKLNNASVRSEKTGYAISVDEFVKE